MAALGDVLVADFSRVLAGPYATMMLADLGATVIKVERPELGDDTRGWSPPVDSSGVATYFRAVNRNKRSVALDLGDQRDVALARELARRADVVVQNFRGDSAARWALDYANVRATNPQVIYCQITGFGPHSSLPGYDLLAQAMSGLMSITGEAGHPTKVGVALVDVLAGLHAVSGILAALYHRAQGGEGQLVEVNLLGSALAAMVNQSAATLGTGRSPQATGNAHPSIAPYAPFPTADVPLVIAVGNDDQFRRLCGALEIPSVAEDPRFRSNSARVAHRAELDALIVGALASGPAEHWQERLASVGVPSGPINDLSAAFRLAEELDLPTEAHLTDGTPTSSAANPVGLSSTPVSYRRHSPALGEHTDQVRDWLGRSADEPRLDP